MAQNWNVTGRKRLALAAADALLWPLAVLDGLSRMLRGGAHHRQPKTILVLEFWRLGDAVLAEPFLRLLRRRFADAEISLLCRDSTRLLLAPSGLIDHFIIADIPWTAAERKYAPGRYRSAGFAALLRRLREERFDVAIDARLDLRSNLMMRLIGARRRIGFDAPGGRLLLTDRVKAPDLDSHKVEDWLAMLTPLGGAGTPLAPRLHVAPYASERARNFFLEAGLGDDKPIVAVHPSAWSPVRRWPISQFRSLVQALVAGEGVRVLVVQDPDGYGGELGDIPGVVLTKPSLEDMVAQLARCDVFLGNDSGPAHIAAAVGADTVTIVGPQVAAWYRPYGEHHRVVQIDDVPCRPCFDHCTQPENFCITQISVPRVLKEVEAVIRRRADRTSSAVDLMLVEGEIPP